MPPANRSVRSALVSFDGSPPPANGISAFNKRAGSREHGHPPTFALDFRRVCFGQESRKLGNQEQSRRQRVEVGEGLRGDALLLTESQQRFASEDTIGLFRQA